MSVYGNLEEAILRARDSPAPARQRGKRSLPREHGTQRGYDQEITRKEPTCPRCRYAHSLYNEARK